MVDARTALVERAAGGARSPDRVRAGRRPSSASTGATHRTSRARPAVVCFPTSTAEVQACVRLRHDATACRSWPAARAPGWPAAPCPLDGAVVIVTHEDEPGPLGRRSTSAWPGWSPACSTSTSAGSCAAHGLHFAPDPSSQQSCSIGGNVATNSGGPHCLAEGVTSMHVLAVEVVLPDGQVTVLGGLDPEPAGLDLRGAFVGGEGMLGIATRIARAAHAEPAGGAHPAARLRRRGRRCRAPCRAIIAAGHRAGGAGDDGRACHPGGRGVRPRRLPDSTPPPSCIVEVDGLPARRGRRRPSAVAAIGRAHGARTVRVAADEAEDGRSSGRAARPPSAPSPASSRTTTCTTRSCPGRKLVEVLRAGLRDRGPPRADRA